MCGQFPMLQFYTPKWKHNLSVLVLQMYMCLIKLTAIHVATVTVLEYFHFGITISITSITITNYQ